MQTKAYLYVTVLLGATLLMGGCGSSGESSSTSSTGTPPVAASRAQTTVAPAAGLSIPAKSAQAAQSSAARLGTEVVASVDGHSLTRQQFEKAYRAASRGIGSYGITATPDPPTYAKCVAGMRSQIAHLEAVRAQMVRRYSRNRRLTPSSTPAPSASVLRRQCELRNRALMTMTMTSLIRTIWTTHQAQAEGITISDAEVSAALAAQRKGFRTNTLYAEYLRRTGLTEAAIAERIRLQLLSQKLYEKRSGPAPRITSAQIAAFIHERRSMLGQSRPISTSQARQLLELQMRARTIGGKAQAAEKRLRERTICRAGYVVSYCANAG
jgi:SurA N-terminal domain